MVLQRRKEFGSFIRNNWAFVLIGLFCLYTLAFICTKGDSLAFHTNDLLDSTLPYYKVYRDALLEGRLNDGFVSPILGGDEMTERLFHPGISLTSIVYTALPAFAAYVSMYFVRILLGIGGFLLIIRIQYDNEKYCRLRNPAAIIGFLYGILPIWPFNGGIMLYPPLLAAIAFAYKRDKLWTGLLIIPFVLLGVSFALYGIFVFAYLLLFFLIDWLRKKRFNIGLLSCMVCLLIPSLLLSMRLIVGVTSGSTIRTEFESLNYRGFHIITFLKSIINILKTGHYHSGTNQQYFVAPLCLVWMILYNTILIGRKEKFWKIITKPYNCCYLWYVINGIVYAVYTDPTLLSFLQTLFPFIKGFNFSRTLWMNPLALYLCVLHIIISISDYIISDSFDRIKGKLAIPIKTLIRVLPALILLCSFSSILNPNTSLIVAMYTDFARNIDYSLHPENNKRFLTWRQLYSEEMFEEIKADIGYKDEWSVAFGFLPSVLSYNGIRTLDGYDSGYSAEYKQQFTKLIQPYLEHGTQYVEYFIKYGARAYIFSDNLDYEDPMRAVKVSEAELYMDMDVFREMNGVYVFSLTSISNAQDLGLTLLGTYTHPESIYQMRVYKAAEAD